jgi:hypothetical protein
VTTEQPAKPAVHPNTVRAVMKKSGLTEARSWRSGQIRGYTCWWSGWRIRTPRNGEPVKVFHQHEFGYDYIAACNYAAQYLKALEGTFVCFVNGRNEVVIVGRKEQVK